MSGGIFCNSFKRAAIIYIQINQVQISGKIGAHAKNGGTTTGMFLVLHTQHKLCLLRATYAVRTHDLDFFETQSVLVVISGVFRGMDIERCPPPSVLSRIFLACNI